jgi:hypothetical protein
MVLKLVIQIVWVVSVNERVTESRPLEVTKEINENATHLNKPSSFVHVR